MNRDELQNALLDLVGKGRNLSWSGQLQVMSRITAHWDKLQALVDAADDVIRTGSSSENYFDGRPEGNAPSHRHSKPPKWDHNKENCGWCVVWMRMRTLVREIRHK